MYEIDQYIMKRFIWKRIPPDGETIILAAGGDGVVTAHITPLGDDPKVWIDIEFCSNDPEWVTLKMIYDYYRREDMTWADWKQNLQNERAASRYKELVATPRWTGTLLIWGAKQWRFRNQPGPVRDLLDALEKAKWPYHIKLNHLNPDQVRDAAKYLRRKTGSHLGWHAANDGTFSWSKP
jgi:hypothetical protein